MRVFVAKEDVSLFGEINIKKDEKLIVSDYKISHNGREYESPVKDYALVMFGLLFSIKETRDLKLTILGI
jgi:hypothetical protein